MDFSKYIQLFPQIQAAFANQGISINLEQAEAIVIELLPLFQSSVPPVVVPPVVVLPTRDQIISYYEKYLGREPEDEQVITNWMTDPNAENDIKNSMEAVSYSASKSNQRVLTGNWGGSPTDPRALGLRAALVSGLVGEAAVQFANSNTAGGGYSFYPDKNVYAIPGGGYILLNGQGGYDYAPGDSGT